MKTATKILLLFLLLLSANAFAQTTEEPTKKKYIFSPWIGVGGGTFANKAERRGYKNHYYKPIFVYTLGLERKFKLTSVVEGSVGIGYRREGNILVSEAEYTENFTNLYVELHSEAHHSLHQIVLPLMLRMKKIPILVGIEPKYLNNFSVIDYVHVKKYEDDGKIVQDRHYHTNDTQNQPPLYGIKYSLGAFTGFHFNIKEHFTVNCIANLTLTELGEEHYTPNVRVASAYFTINYHINYKPK